MEEASAESLREFSALLRNFIAYQMDFNSAFMDSQERALENMKSIGERLKARALPTLRQLQPASELETLQASLSSALPAASRDTARDNAFVAPFGMQAQGNTTSVVYQPVDELEVFFPEVTSAGLVEVQLPLPGAPPGPPSAQITAASLSDIADCCVDTGCGPPNDTRLVSVNRADRDTIGHSNVASAPLASANLQTPNLLCVAHRMAIGTLLLRTKGAGLVILQFDPVVAWRPLHIR
jgi:hypothetical protein